MSIQSQCYENFIIARDVCKEFGKTIEEKVVSIRLRARSCDHFHAIYILDKEIALKKEKEIYRNFVSFVSSKKIDSLLDAAWIPDTNLDEKRLYARGYVKI